MEDSNIRKFGILLCGECYSNNFKITYNGKEEILNLYCRECGNTEHINIDTMELSISNFSLNPLVE